LHPRDRHSFPTRRSSDLVLAAPTASGASAGAAGPAVGTTILPNNVIPFDLVSSAASVVNWGDSKNSKLLTGLLRTVLGMNRLDLDRKSTRLNSSHDQISY